MEYDIMVDRSLREPGLTSWQYALVLTASFAQWHYLCFLSLPFFPPDALGDVSGSSLCCVSASGDPAMHLFCSHSMYSHELICFHVKKKLCCDSHLYV